MKYLKYLAFCSLAFILVVSFITCSSNGPDTDNQPPASPAVVAPPNGSTGITVTPTLRWNCSDPDGDAILYDVHLGISSPPPTVSTEQAEFTYISDALSYNTTYYWMVVAKDKNGATTSSDTWSFTTGDEPPEYINAPNKPSGYSGGKNTQSLAYATGGAVSSEGHDIEYRFDWDDGDVSSWSASTTVAHAWALAGTYSIKAQARCATDNEILSKWSSSKTITIGSQAETVNMPDVLNGPGVGGVNETLIFVGGGSNTNYNHNVEYQFDWEDGSFSDWTATASASHAWTQAGNYTVKVRARCASHNEVVSNWSTLFIELIIHE